MQLGTKMIPTATKLVTKLLPGVATGAVGALTDFGVSKALGSGQKGEFLIPQNRIDKLVAHKNLLTKKQKEQLLTALQSGGKLVIKPTPKQRGGFLGTLLASIGVPLLVKALTGGNLQNRSSLVARRTPPIIVPKRPRVVTKKSGTGMQNRPPRNVPYYPPPIWTNPEDLLGKGIKGKKKDHKKEKGCY